MRIDCDGLREYGGRSDGLEALARVSLEIEAKSEHSVLLARRVQDLDLVESDGTIERDLFHAYATQALARERCLAVTRRQTHLDPELVVVVW